MLSSTFIHLVVKSIPTEFLKVVVAGGTILYTTDTLSTFDNKVIAKTGDILYIVSKIGVRIYLIIQSLQLLEFLLIIFELI